MSENFKLLTKNFMDYVADDDSKVAVDLCSLVKILTITDENDDENVNEEVM